MNLFELIRNKKVIVCAGTGGVGKTTLSSVLGVLAAREGKKVLVLTVDPARRLATALGLDHLKPGDTKVSLPNVTGELYASVVDPKSVFDSFVKENTSSKFDADRILNNRIYLKLSTALSGSQEFTALEKFYRAYESKTYDLVILDTPPASHALDFLDSAARLSALFHDSVVKWFIKPLESKGFITNMISRGTGVAFKALERLTGGEFIKELIEFFMAIYSLKDSLVSRLESIQSILRSSDASFILVTAFDETKLKLAETLNSTLRDRGYSLGQVIINRSFPEISLEAVTQEVGNDSPDPEVVKIIALYKKLQVFYGRHREAVASFKQTLGSQVEIRLIPDQDQDIFEINGLTRLADVMAENP